MAVSVTVAGVSYTIPTVGDNTWGASVTSWIQAVSTSMLQTTGGTFALTADANFGLSFGLISQYYKSASSNIAQTGVLRLANADKIEWRNAANSADIGLYLDNTNTFQLGGPLTITGNVTASNFTGSNTGDVTLTNVGSSPSAQGASLSGQALTLQPADATHPGLVSTAAQSFAGIKTFGSAALFADGSSGNPGIAFASETGTGFYRSGAGDLVLMVNGVQIAEFLKSGSNVNIGFGPSGTVSSSLGNPLSFSSSNNGIQYFQFNNSSTGTASVTSFQILNGTPSLNNSTEIGNGANLTTGYLAGGSWLSATPFQSQLNVMCENASGYIGFNVGGRTLATERARLTTTSLTLNGGLTLAQVGSSSGTITFQAQAAAGTYNWNWPITVGSAGTVLTSQGGSSTAMTWSSVLSNPLTTKGDLIATSTGSPARLPVGTNGQFLGADSTATNGISWQNPINTQNFLVNGAFDYWQAGTSATVTATGAGTPTATYLYQADQWYVNNILGGGTIEGIITYSQVTGVTNGSKWGAKVQITTAPTGTGIQNGCELYQTLSNLESYPLYGQTASFSVLVKSFNNVTQVGVQFYFKTTEAKVATAIGSEILTTVNSSTFTACTINGQALGTSQTAAGVIGIRIRPTAVSTGNLYDLNNGFVVEQAMLNLGPVAQSFSRQHSNPAQEFAACQYFYEKSYDPTVAPGTINTTGSVDWQTRLALSASTPGSLIPPPPQFKVTKRTTPTVTLWDPTANTSAAVRNVTTGNSRGGCTPANIGLNSFFGVTVDGTSAVSVALDAEIRFQWVADARI